MIELRNVTKHYGSVAAVDDLSLQIAPGEFLTLLGPSGSGKTTLLRLIGGLDMPTSGTVWLDGEEVTHLPPYRRPVNQVFQSYALFPHLTVAENVSFGLRMQRVEESAAAARVRAALALVSLDGLDARRPHQLSGGQKQRVALARALVCRPKVLLLDEPLSALDAKLRHAMQLELKRLQRQLGITFVFVTHDQAEALLLSDRIALISRGRIEQLGSAHEIYHRPASRFAADFVGQANLLEARLGRRDDAWAFVAVAGGLELVLPAADWPEGATTALIAIRPEKVHVSKSKSRPEGPAGTTNIFEARIVEEVFQGATDHLVLVTASGTRLDAIVANESALGEIFHAGELVCCGLHADDLVVVRAE